MGVVTNLFFWSNRYHDRLYELGFTEAARNFQQDNFGRGGLGNDFVRAEAQDFSGTNNANFGTPPDGQLPRMQMFIFTGPNPDRDGDLDQEIVLHELTHGTSNRLHANATGLGSNVSGGMGEGWSDYYARALLSTADEDVNGLYASGAYATFQLSLIGTNNYYYGIRRFPYAVKTTVGPNGKPHNPLTFADTDPAQINTTDGAFPENPLNFSGNGALEVHNLGEIWCMTLLEMRARLITRLGWAVGNQRALQLVTDGMKLDPVNPNMLQGRNSILLADCAGFSGQDELDIWAGFAARGMGFSARYNSATSVTEAFDIPNLTLGAVTISNDSCPPSDGFADPGESLTLNIPLSNPFCAIGANGVTISVDGGAPQGELLYIECRPTGLLKLKSTSMQSLSIVGVTGVIIGKATINGMGNYTFRATVVDNGEPGRDDQFGLRVTAPGGAVVPGLTFDPITLSGGNIQVPHQSSAAASTALK